MSKIEIEVLEFRPLQRNTLQGFATIRIGALRLRIRDVAIHESHAKRWAQLPAKPMLDSNRQAVVKDNKVQYSPFLLFDTQAVTEAFSTSVIRALDAFEAKANTEPLPA